MKEIASKQIVPGGRLVWSAPVREGVTFLLGGIGYGLVEVLWRGFTHPSMVLTGGLCFSFIGVINRKMQQKSFLLRCVLCSLVITAVEFCVGLVVNCLLGLNVWDYSEMRLHLFGQICPLYTFFWFLLCIPVVFVLSCLSKRAKKEG